MNKIEHEIKIEGTLHEIYSALTTLSGLQSWHSAHVEGNPALQGEFDIIHENHPSFTWKVTFLEEDKHIQWLCTKGPGNAPGTEVCFDLSPCNDNRILVACTHQGWSDTNDNFKKCNTLWGMLLDHLKQYVETGKVSPTFI